MVRYRGVSIWNTLRDQFLNHPEGIRVPGFILYGQLRQIEPFGAFDFQVLDFLEQGFYLF